ncbi:hypothetical protein ABTX35_18955 [Streptomyces sp. NPDC096080]|uniref:hypothetical protein n=1 Tax=Streptomyces sp. NPDC096080 TaxID=3156693 RepID=UPI0033302CD2
MHPLADIDNAITLLRAPQPRGRVDSNSEHLLIYLAALMRLRDPLTTWLEEEQERLSLLGARIDRPDDEPAVQFARALLGTTPVLDRHPDRETLEKLPSTVIVDNARATLNGSVRPAGRQTEGGR